jgi:hypothetical protein
LARDPPAEEDLLVATRASTRSDARRRLRRRWRRWSWAAIGLLALASLVLGHVGYRAYFEDTGQAGSHADAFYRSLQLFGLEGGDVDPVPWQLQIARFLAPIVTALALIRAIVAVFRERAQAWRLWRMRDHVIVCGLGARGLLFAKRFRERGEDVVVIEHDPEAHGLDDCRDRGIVVLIADATDDPALARARPERARRLIAVGSDDSTNAEVAAEARVLVAEQGGRLEAFVHVVGIRLCSLLRERERAAPGAGSLNLRFFNVFEAGARAWLDEYPPFGDGSAPREGRPRLVVVGVGQMGKSLVVGAVRSWLALKPQARERPRITLVDLEATRKREWLLLEHPQLEQFCELDGVDIDITTAAFDRAEFLFSDGHCDASSIYVCLDDDARGLAAALAVAQRVNDDRVEVVVRMKEHAGLATLLERDGAGREFGNVHAFRVLDRTCTPEFLLGETRGEQLAKAIHAEYVRDQQRRGETPASNPAMVSWDELPEDLKESNRRQADHDRVKLRAVGRAVAEADGRVEPARFSDAEIERMARLEHDRWVAERRFEGWTYAPGAKSPGARTTPHLVPWDELPDEVRNHDRNTVRALPERFARAGLRISRGNGGGA